jgi:hypothetical protein
MKFNIAYLGPERLFHLRRDFILLLKYALEDAGHDAVISGSNLDANRFNLIIGAYFLDSTKLAQISASRLNYAHINTEVIDKDMLNYNPNKVDFMGAYLPSIRGGRFAWDVIMDNMREHKRYGVNAHFLRWGAHPKMRDIEHRTEKDLDFYFFGTISERRNRLLQLLLSAGLTGGGDSSCPYFLRNDRISRSRVQLNLIQDEKYTHVNSFRICYLADNGCCILSENENDPAGYLKYAEIVDQNTLVEQVRNFIANDRWRARGEKARADFAENDMGDIIERLLEESFCSPASGPDGGQ